MFTFKDWRIYSEDQEGIKRFEGYGGSGPSGFTSGP